MYNDINNIKPVNINDTQEAALKNYGTLSELNRLNKNSFGHLGSFKAQRQHLDNSRNALHQNDEDQPSVKLRVERTNSIDR